MPRRWATVTVLAVVAWGFLLLAAWGASDLIMRITGH